MTDKEIADKVVAILGNTLVANLVGFAKCEGEEISRDPLVAMALMEKCGEVTAELHGEYWKVQAWDRKDGFAENESLPCAIIEAGVGALDE